MHGGGFTKGDKHSFITPLFEPLAKAGFTWFTINYRLAPQHRWPACADDVASAIRWVKAHAAEYKVDVSRIALIGESAGGHLVSWASVTGVGDTRVAAVVPFYPPQDLVTHVKRRNELRGLGDLIGSHEMSEANFAKLAEMSPITHVKAGLPPFLQIHGDADTTVAHGQSVMFNGLHLDAMYSRWLVTKDEEARVKARKLVAGLLKLSSVGETPGFIAQVKVLNSHGWKVPTNGPPSSYRGDFAKPTWEAVPRLLER